MVEIKVLIEGYANKKDGYAFASSSTVLVRENNLNVIVDPGMNRKLLLDALAKNNLSTSKISFVVLTHNHIDHALLTGIFENTYVLDDVEIYSQNGKIETHGGLVPGTDIKIIKTPGHDMFHCSLLVDTKEFGKVAIVGDVFWWNDNQKQETDNKALIKHRDLYVKNKEDLINSRKKVLKIADYIIPGHGKIFKVNK